MQEEDLELLVEENMSRVGPVMWRAPPLEIIRSARTGSSQSNERGPTRGKTMTYS